MSKRSLRSRRRLLEAVGVAPQDVLRRVRYFVSLPAAELRDLAGKCRPRRLDAGEVRFAITSLAAAGKSSVGYRRFSGSSERRVARFGCSVTSRSSSSEDLTRIVRSCASGT